MFETFQVKYTEPAGYPSMQGKQFTVIEETADHYVLAGKPGFWGKGKFTVLSVPKPTVKLVYNYVETPKIFIVKVFLV